MPEDNEFTIRDMVNTVVDGSPTKFADVFSGVMVDRVNDRVDQIRQAVAAKINGDDTSTDPAMEPGPEEVDDYEEQEVEASFEEDEVETEEPEEIESDGEEIEGTDGTDED